MWRSSSMYSPTGQPSGHHTGQPSGQSPLGSPVPAAASPFRSGEVHATPSLDGVDPSRADGAADALIGIDEVQKALNRSRASVYRYTNTDPRQLNPPFNPRRLNPEYRSDQKEPLQFHPNEVARFARDVLRIKEVTVEVLNAPSTATQELLSAILEEIRAIRQRLDGLEDAPASLAVHRNQSQARPAA